GAGDRRLHPGDDGELSRAIRLVGDDHPGRHLRRLRPHLPPRRRRRGRPSAARPAAVAAMLKRPQIVTLAGWAALLAMIGGGVVTGAALLWWFDFYRGIGLGDAVSCIYSRSGACGFIARVAAEAGRMAYSPKLFWLGILAFCGGG